METSPATDRADASVEDVVHAQNVPPAAADEIADASTPSPVTDHQHPGSNLDPYYHQQPQDKGFDPLEALKLGSLRLANMIKREGNKQPLQQQDHAAAASEAGVEHQQGNGEGPVARFRATAAELGARAKQQGSRFYQVSVKTAATTAEAVKRLATGEPVQALCRNELGLRPCPQLVLSCCNTLVQGGGLSTERIFKHNPPQELVDRLAAAVAGQGMVSLVPPGASPHAVAALLKQFLLGLPEPLLTYRLLPQWVAAGDNPATCQVLLQQLPPANTNTLRLLVQTCHYVNEQSAANEMDAQALAEVLVPCIAWNPPPKPQGSAPVWRAPLTKALSINKHASAGAAAADQQAEGAAVAEAEGPAPAAVSGEADAVAVAHADAQALDDVQQEALVTVLDFMITNFNAIFN